MISKSLYIKYFYGPICDKCLTHCVPKNGLIVPKKGYLRLLNGLTRFLFFEILGKKRLGKVKRNARGPLSILPFLSEKDYYVLAQFPVDLPYLAENDFFYPSFGDISPSVTSRCLV